MKNIIAKLKEIFTRASDRIDESIEKKFVFCGKGKTYYEQIKEMDENQLTEFLLDFVMKQLREVDKKRVDIDKFREDTKNFLLAEVDFNEYDKRDVIV